jgi:hypothetical protein
MGIANPSRAADQVRVAGPPNAWDNYAAMPAPTS